MTDEEFHELLADYVAGELDQARAAAFRAELEADPERRKLAHEFQAAAAALEANLLSPAQAARRTEHLALAEERTSSAPGANGWSLRRGRRTRTILSYAAVIVLAFGAGFLARGMMLNRPETQRMAPGPATTVNERFVANFQQATQSFPHSSSFSRSLLMLARP